MSESITLNTINRAHVDQLTKDKGEPEWLEKLRLKAFEQYMEADSPSTRSDDWRKTLVETLELSTLSPAPAGASAEQSSNSKAVFESRLKSLAGVIKHVGNSAVEHYLAPGLAEKGVVLTTLDECIRTKSDLVKELFESKDLSRETGKLSFMTAAFFASGAFLYVPRGVAVEQPFVIINELSPDMVPGQVIFPRIIILADESAQINVVNVFEGSGSATGSTEKAPKGKRNWIVTSAIVDVVARASASVHYLELYNFGAQVFSVARNNNSVGRDAAIYALTAALGGGQLKSDIITSLKDRGASADIRGVAFGDGDEHFFYNTVQNHDASDTVSNINFRVALNGKAVSSYQGNIRVAISASGTDAFQSNKNLLLSETAKAESIPRLEILTDDVKCSHGATVGPVDKNQLFYLMSRGLSAKEAEEFIVSGFFNEIFSSLKIEGAAEWFENLIGDKIHSVERTLQGAKS